MTSWFRLPDGRPAFTDTEGVAVAHLSKDRSTLVVKLHAGRIDGFTANGSRALDVRTPAGALKTGKGSSKATTKKVGRIVLPKLTVDSSLYGTAYTHGKSTLKQAFGEVVHYGDDSQAAISLHLPGLDDSEIGTSGASVALVDGDGYYPEEYDFEATDLPDFVDGTSTYELSAGDLEMDTQGYLTSDVNSGREWSCLGGDGQGNYYYNLEVSGLTYRGLPVASHDFGAHVYIYGYNYTADATGLYGDGTTVTPEWATLADKTGSAPAPGAKPKLTWVGDGDEPNLADSLADDVYVTWPTGVDGSGLTADDVEITLHSEEGDSLTLVPGTDFEVQGTGGESQIAILYHNWAFVPVYSTMTVSVDGAAVGSTAVSKTYDIGSVYAYEAQQGGGGTTVDGTVVAYSFYGLANLTDPTQVTTAATYTLSVVQDDTTYYYAEDGDGVGSLVTDQTAAKTYDASGADERNIQLIENSVYTTTRRNQTEDKTVDGDTVTFTKSYSGGGLLQPQLTSGLEVEPGYILPTGTTWVVQEKWAWQPAIAVGWTGVDIQPYTGKFEYEVEVGASQQFTADEDVTWSLLNAQSPDTTIDENGLLTIGEDETATTFAVIATSTTDDSEEGVGTVNVKVVAAPTP
ncbi:hypothetical protein E8D37_15370 [Nocardioides sp. GY 10127]|nr:hypothetical protein E8D37_15370 [Nocardioides sp. GY 10127]